MASPKTELTEVVIHHSPPLTRWEQGFIDHMKEMGTAIHQLVVEKGWWKEERNNGEMIALIHADLAEALEAMRKENPPDSKVPEFSSVEVELADMIIRILDMAANRKWRVAEALVEKHRFNQSQQSKDQNLS